MPFDDVLARSLEAIERGATVEDCLAQYPHYAQALEPLLRLAFRLQAAAPPRLADAAFARGRAAVAAQARYHQRLRSSLLAEQLSHQPAHQTSTNGRLPAHQSLAVAPPPVVRPVAALPRWSNLLVVLVMVFSLFTITRAVVYSTPGSPLYGLKGTGERVEGFLLAAAGQEARWHMRQVSRRLAELDALARQGITAPDLITTIDAEVNAAVTTSAALPEAERTGLFADWLADLRGGQPANPPATTVVTLGRVLATVEAAADGPEGPTVLLLTPTATVTETPTNLPSPATPTPLVEGLEGAEAAPSPSTVLVELPTVTPTPQPTPLPLIQPPPTWTNTATPPPPSPVPPTAAPPPAQVGPSAGSEEEDEDEERERPTATPTTAPPTATATLVVTPTATIAASPSATATFTATVATVTPTVTNTLTPTATPTGWVTATITATATLTDTPSPSLTPVTETPTPTATVTPRTTWTPETPATPIIPVTVEPPTATETATSEPTPTSESSTETPQPTETPPEPTVEPGETATPDEEEDSPGNPTSETTPTPTRRRG
jgi:hypothetical protein